MHVFVRKKLLAHPEWDLAAWGVPISCGDAMLTLMGGSFAPGTALAAIGFVPSRADILALMHFWRYVGHLMGVRPSWYPTTLREAVQLAFVTAIKGVRGSGDDGDTLCRSYADAFAPPRDVPLRARWRDELEHRMHLAYTQLFMSRRSHRAHGLPRAWPWMLALVATAPATATIDVARRLVPSLDRIVDRVARARRDRWFARHMAGRTAEYVPSERFTR